VAADGARVGGLAARYASALYDLADEQGALDRVAGDLNTLRGMLDQSEEFSRFIRSPVLSRIDQSKGIAALAAAAQLTQLTQNFLGLVARNRRLFALPEMIRGYFAILADRRGQQTAEVISAVPLSDAQVSALTTALKTSGGRNVAVSTKVDPSILGGLIVRVGSRMVDSSLRSKLQRLKLAMKGVG
jgi:F-type H+-transporting ATPase subunit delta